MKKSFYIFLLSTLYFAGVSQNCDTTVTIKQKQYKKYHKKIQKGKSISYKYADLLFAISSYVRQQGDTTYKKWYNVTLDLYKQGFDHCRKNISLKQLQLYKMGLCYFYIEDYESATTYFSKTIASRCENPCVQYYLSLSQQKENRK